MRPLLVVSLAIPLALVLMGAAPAPLELMKKSDAQHRVKGERTKVTLSLQEKGGPERVRSLIMATRHGEQPTDPAHQLLVDVDLAILGADPDRYREFELQIRAEYWWVPTALYRKQRIAILRSFIMRRSVYATHEFRERYERLARNNLSWAMEQLEFGTSTFRWTARF